jgi:hypothetical protein
VLGGQAHQCLYKMTWEKSNLIHIWTFISGTGESNWLKMWTTTIRTNYSYVATRKWDHISLLQSLKSWAGCLICLIPLSVQQLSSAQIVKNDSESVAVFKLHTIKGSQEIIACCTEHKTICGFKLCFWHEACLPITEKFVKSCENIYYL